MTQTRSVIQLSCLMLIVGASACVPVNQNLLDSSQSQLQTRQIQSRAFDTPDIERTLRAAIATLQDLGFVVDKADLDIGTVTATKLDGYSLRMTVTVRARGKSQVIVRANAQYNLHPVTDPQPYQSFFVALERSMFLSAHAVD
jgi:hypothetical protein